MKNKTIIAILIALILILGIGGWKFFDIYKYARAHVPNNTEINGVDCSGLSVNEAEQKLTDEWNSRTFRIKEDGKEIGRITGLDYEYSIEKSINDITDRGPMKTVLRHVKGGKHSYDVSMQITGDPESLKSAVNKMKFLKAKYKTKTRDAFVDLSDRNFLIVKEVYGDNIDPARFVERVKKEISQGIFELDYSASEYYELPKLKAEDKEIKERKKWCKAHLAQVITYKFRDGEQTLTPAQLNDVLEYDDNDKKSVREKALKKLVYSFAENHNTAYGTRSFKTHGGSTISISGGDYGWILNKEKEEKRLKKVLLSGKDEALEPIYSQRPYYEGSGSDIGDSYVEVDLGSQHLYLVQNGKVTLDCNIVSGKMSDGHGTPGGTYSLDYKQRNTTLKGLNTDGTKYESKVSYWMPFNGGIGLHDATWRSAFGGNIYYSNGSHGCVNMPPSSAAYVFGQIDEGYPIVVYY